MISIDTQKSLENERGRVQVGALHDVGNYTCSAAIPAQYTTPENISAYPGTTCAIAALLL